MLILNGFWSVMCLVFALLNSIKGISGCKKTFNFIDSTSVIAMKWQFVGGIWQDCSEKERLWPCQVSFLIFVYILNQLKVMSIEPFSNNK